MTEKPNSNPGFADRLIELLSEAALRPEDFAEKIGAPLELVEDYLRGTMPDALSLSRIAKALDTTVEWLVAGEEVRIRKEGLH